MNEPERCFVDTNLLVRFFTKDNPEQSPAAARFVERIKSGEVVAVVSDSVVFETVYVLAGRIYEVERSDIETSLGGFLSSKGVVTIGVIDFKVVLEMYVRFPKLSFADCAHAWLASQYTDGKIVSFDTDFDALEEVDRIDLMARPED